MKPWRLTPHAEESLVDILTWTIENFGDRQALAYHDGLIARINKLASGAAPHAKSCALLMQGRAGAEALTYYHEGGHYIIMRDTDELLEVLAFFHQNSNLPSHLEKIK
ncbi:MAG: type II toxin-antitoxin system RelE/ParE family toxin [Parvularculaceae bacterium]